MLRLFKVSEHRTSGWPLNLSLKISHQGYDNGHCNHELSDALINTEPVMNREGLLGLCPFPDERLAADGFWRVVLYSDVHPMVSPPGSIGLCHTHAHSEE